MSGSLVWDNHACMPLRPEDETFLPRLREAKDAGYDVISLNIGFDSFDWSNAVLMAATFRRWVSLNSDLCHLVESVADIEYVRRENKLGVVFDVEGGCALNNHLPMVQLYYDLGVRWMLLAYNRNNALAGGCQDEEQGLTDFGRQVVREMERVGMAVCCSHTSHKASMEIMEMARHPVIFSHSNPRAIKDHCRNIEDEAILACAGTGGVIAITGVGDFLGDNDPSTENIVRHIDYVVQLVGAEHVGFSTDYCFDEQELMDFLKNNPELYDPRHYSDGMKISPPSQLPEIADALLRMNYKESDVRGILGENHLRIAREVWR